MNGQNRKMPWPPRTRRDVIEHAKAAYAGHVETMAELHPNLAPLKPWDEQDAAVREAWIEYATPDAAEYAGTDGLGLQIMEGRHGWV